MFVILIDNNINKCYNASKLIGVKKVDIAIFVFGFAGVLSTVFIYQQKNRYGLLVAKLISDIIWFLYYFLQGAYAGAAVAVIGIIRELIFINKDKKWAKHPIWLVFFIILAIGSAALTWKTWFSILPMIASITSIISFWIGNPKVSRILSFPISACMLTYDVTLIPIAYFGVANEILAISSSIIGLVRYDRVKKAG